MVYLVYVLLLTVIVIISSIFLHIEEYGINDSYIYTIGSIIQ